MSTVLEVPLLEPDSFLTLDVANDLPDDPQKMSQLLSDEKCTLRWWTAIASGYYRLDSADKATVVAEKALQSEAAQQESRVDVLCLLSSLALQRMRLSVLADRTNLYSQALDYANDAVTEARSDRSTGLADSEQLLARAQLAQAAVYSAVANHDAALPLFTAVLERDPHGALAPLAALGRARALYARRNFRAALKLFQTLLTQCPRRVAAADARIGIGLCFWHLGDRSKARKAWERSLAANADHAPTCAAAHSALGVWHLYSALHGPRAAFAESYKRAMYHFQQGYTLGQVPFNALRIAAYLYSKKDMELVKRLTAKVLTTASMPRQLAEARFWEARTAHFEQDLLTAHRFYAQAVEAEDATTNGGNVAACIGKGIVEWLLDRHPEALLTFEAATRQFKTSPDVFFYSGFFAYLSKTDALLPQARAHLDTYLRLARAQRQQARPQALLALASLREAERDFQGAFDLLRQAEELAPPSAPLLANSGVLAFQLNKFAEAKTLFARAAQAPGEVSGRLLEYNAARAQEALGELDEARAAYARLHDVDSLARLVVLDAAGAGSLSAAGGSAAPAESSTVAESGPERAIPACLRLLTRDPRNLELRALAAYVYRLAAGGDGAGAREAALQEQELLKQTLKEIDKHDVYSLVAMGNTYLRRAEALPKSDPSTRFRAFARAADFYTKALQLDARCAYAAQGLAIVLVDTKHAAQALPVFARCRETLATPQALVNTAHCHVELGEYKRAAELYSLARAQLDLVHAVPVLQALARCCALSSARSLDPKDLEAALDWARQARDVALTPVSEMNLALLQVQFCDFLLQCRSRMKTGSGARAVSSACKSVEKLEHALQLAREGVKTLTGLAADTAKIPYTADDLEGRVGRAEAAIESLEQEIEDQRTEDAENEQKRTDAQRVREEELHKLAEQEAAEQNAREELEKQLAAERERLQEQARQWELERQQERASAAKEKEVRSDERKKRRRKRADSDDEVEFQSGSEKSDGESAPPPAESDDDAHEVDADEVPPTEQVPRRAVVGDSDDDDEPVPAAAGEETQGPQAGAADADDNANADSENASEVDDLF